MHFFALDKKPQLAIQDSQTAKETYVGFQAQMDKIYHRDLDALSLKGFGASPLTFLGGRCLTDKGYSDFLNIRALQLTAECVVSM